MIDTDKLLKYTQKLNLLYVEDNEDTREMTAILLEDFFDDITVAVDGVDGYEKFKNSKIDLIITDINMPNMDGLEMSRKIKEIDSDIPIVIFSAYNESEYFLKSIHIGISDFLFKPVSVDNLVSVLEKVLTKSILVSEAKTSTKLLHEYQDIIDNSAIVSKTDLEGNITYVNDEFCKVSKYDREELIGKPHSIIRDPDMPSSAFKEMWNTIKNKKKIWKGVVKNRTKDNQVYYVDSTIKPILDIDGNIVEYIALRKEITELINLNNEVKELYNYDKQQQLSAKEKIETGIRNDMSRDEAEVIYKPLDILSGDMYSLYKCKDGSTFVYIIDGQGHGIVPALTIFAVSTIINNTIDTISSLKELIDKIFPTIAMFLDEIEQLSFTMIMLSPDAKKLEYSIAGMYPFLLKTDDETRRVKANNTPFMNFSATPTVHDINIDGWNSLLLFSDGFVEHDNDSFDAIKPMDIINTPELITTARSIIDTASLDDDLTLIYLNNRKK